jgi:hypothetical protein
MTININESDIEYLKKLKYLNFKKIKNEEELKDHVKFCLNVLNNIYKINEIKDKKNN